MTFDDLVKAEAKRREIEQLTEQINAFLKAATFSVSNTYGVHDAVPMDCVEPIRQAGIEAIAAKVIKLLEECRHLGIDVTSARNALAKVLRENNDPLAFDVTEPDLDTEIAQVMGSAA